MKTKIYSVIALVALFMLSACGGNKDAEDLKENAKVIRYQLESNPPELDPSLTTDTVSGIILGATFEGLTRLNKVGEAIPGVAESWENNGLEWTFHLRKDAKWHNGDNVVAEDFVSAWERVLNPDSAAQYSYIMYSIKNAQNYNEGKITDFSQVGIKKIDDYTLKVELNEPVAYLPSLMAFYVFYPQNTKFYSEKKFEYGTSAENIVGNGPFELKEWVYESKVVVEKADTYWNKGEIKVDRIEMPIILDRTTAYNVYKNDEVDMIVMPNEFVDKYKDSEELVPYEDASVWYLNFNDDVKWLSNKKIRQALSYAIDRNDLVEKVKNGSGAVATSYVPNSIMGYKKAFREEYPQSNYFDAYNPEKAKKLFAEGLKELNMTLEDIGTVSLIVNSNDVGLKEGQFYQEQLNKNLGLNVLLEPVTFQIRLQRTKQKDFQIVLAGWGPDYNDPMTFMDMWLSTSSYAKETGFANAEYDKLILSAKASGDNKYRMEAMAKAEAILMDEMTIAPTFFRKKFTLVKPHVKGVIRRPLSPDPDFYYAEVTN
jgi:oligopeptide transport system substrate-binding protein